MQEKDIRKQTKANNPEAKIEKIEEEQISKKTEEEIQEIIIKERKMQYVESSIFHNIKKYFLNSYNDWINNFLIKKNRINFILTFIYLIYFLALVLLLIQISVPTNILKEYGINYSMEQRLTTKFIILTITGYLLFASKRRKTDKTEDYNKVMKELKKLLSKSQETNKNQN